MDPSNNVPEQVAPAAPVETVGPPIRLSRSGRAIRSVQRYEPDPDTVFEDDVGYESLGEMSDGVDGDVSDVESDTSNGSGYTSCESSDGELETELDPETEVETVVSEDDEDVLDWDRLTEDAGSDDESMDDMESDDDE